MSISIVVTSQDMINMLSPVFYSNNPRTALYAGVIDGDTVSAKSVTNEYDNSTYTRFATQAVTNTTAQFNNKTGSAGSADGQINLLMDYLGHGVTTPININAVVFADASTSLTPPNLLYYIALSSALAITADSYIAISPFVSGTSGISISFANSISNPINS